MIAESETSSLKGSRMATAVSSRPSVSHQKLNRPTPPAVQTSLTNGASPSSSSPSATNKRAPTGTVNSGSTGVNGAPNVNAASRLGPRRRDSAKPNDGPARQQKGLRSGALDSPVEKRTKRPPEPFVRTTSYILKKYNKSPPSFVLHLHATHFRFDEQDGSFSYTSPMKILLEHIKEQTVPHDMIDELISAGIKFYENCLIVQIQDHRNSTKSASTSPSTVKDSNQPFSIHNYNEHVTPSPFVPYPHTKPSDSTKVADGEGVSKEGDAEKAGTKNQASGENKATAEGPKTFTTVLFPTSFSFQEELLRLANTPDTRFNKNKQAQPGTRAPSSTAIAPTPSAGAGAAGTSANGPPAKKQRMMFSYSNLAEIESQLISANAPPLFLDPAKDFREAQSLIEGLKDPLCQRSPPAPKDRKRTVAELAADEAFAAEEQRFMLIMDERLVPSTTAAAGGKAPTASGEEAGATHFEARFERFKAIEEIRTLLEEKKQREAEAKAAHQLALQQQAQAAKAKQEQEDLEKQRQAAHEQKMREATARRQEMLRIHQIQQTAMQQSAAAQQKTNGVSQNPQFAASQGPQSSPVARTTTPHNQAANASSPPMPNAAAARAVQAPAMAVTSSQQSAGSPPRPGSAMQNPQMPPQRNQPGSRVGTPSMPNQTPQQARATPVLGNASNAGTPRMPQGSPVNVPMGTPVMNRQISNQGPMAAGQMSLQQQQAFMHQQQQRAIMAQAAQRQQQQQQQQAQLQQMQQAQRNEMNYRQQLQSLQQQQMSSMQAQAQGQNFGANMNPNQQQAAMQQQAAQAAAGQPQNPMQRMWQMILHREFEAVKQKALQTYGNSNIPAHVMEQMKMVATQRANQIMKNEQHRRQAMAQMQQQQMQQQQQQQAGMMNNMNMGNMGGMMGGMNGMGGGMGNM